MGPLSGAFDRGSSCPMALFRLLGARGQRPAEAGNLTALALGLALVEAG